MLKEVGYTLGRADSLLLVAEVAPRVSERGLPGLGFKAVYNVQYFKSSLPHMASTSRKNTKQRRGSD